MTVRRKRDIHPKVVAAGVGGAAVTVLVAIAAAAGYHATPELAAALSTLAAFGFGYLKSS
jgi:hypothetical protein